MTAARQPSIAQTAPPTPVDAGIRAAVKLSRRGGPRQASPSTGLEGEYARIHRLLRIISLIQGQKGWNTEALARECRVTQRTIYRDLQMLEGAGIPYFYDTQSRCYQIQRSFFMKPVELTLDEALALIALGEHIGGQEQIPFTRPAGRAVAKLRSQLPASLRRQLSRLDAHIGIQLAASQSPHGISDVYEKVQQAIASQRALRCTYEAVTGGGAARAPDASGRGDTLFLFKPYCLFFSQRAWYAVGHHAGRRAVRCLKLNRFTSLEASSEAYRIPRGFSLDKHLDLAWRMIRGQRRYRVCLRFDPAFAETISDTHWHATQELTWNDDRSLTFRCRVDGLVEIVWWVLSMGPHCTVLEPPELAMQVRELAQQIVALYPGD